MDLLSGRSFSIIEKRLILSTTAFLLASYATRITTRSVINWIIDFLSNCFQRTKLADCCYSEWGSVPSEVPQGTKLGPIIIMINDLVVSDACVWKYVDDTTSSEVVRKGETSGSQLCR